MAEPAERIERSANREYEAEVERRRSPRAPLVVRIAYSTVDALFSEFTRNINEGGLFIETENPPPTDTRVALQFKLPGSDVPIQARGRVARVQHAGRRRTRRHGRRVRESRPRRPRAHRRAGARPQGPLTPFPR